MIATAAGLLRPSVYNLIYHLWGFYTVTESSINGNKCKFCVIINLIQLDYFSLMNPFQVAAMWCTCYIISMLSIIGIIDIYMLYFELIVSQFYSGFTTGLFIKCNPFLGIVAICLSRGNVNTDCWSLTLTMNVRLSAYKAYCIKICELINVVFL